ADMQRMMNVHLAQTISEATVRLAGHFVDDVRAFDAVVVHILDMADMFADGIARQFPDKVSVVVFPGEDVHLAMRKLWEDHVIWTRDVIIAAVPQANCTTTLADLNAAITRLQRNQIDIGNAVRPL